MLVFEACSWVCLALGLGGALTAFPTEPGTLLWLLAAALGWAVCNRLATKAEREDEE